MNSNNERIINFLYAQIELLEECFAVLREDKIGLIGLRGEIIVDAVYNKIECVNIKNNTFCLGSKDDLVRGGIIDSTSYLGYCEDYCFDTDGHLDYRGNKYDALIRNSITTYQGYGVGINLSCPENFDLSRPLILTTNEYQELFTNEEGIVENSRFCSIQQITQRCFVVQQDDLYGVFRIDAKSLIIPIEFRRIKFMGGHTVLMCKDNLWGAADLLLNSHLVKSLFKVDIECKNAELSILEDSQSLFGAKTPYKNYKDEDEAYFAILNKKGEETGDFHSQYLESPFTRFDDRHFLTSKHGKFGFITKSAYVSIPFIYDEITPRKGGNFNIRIGKAWGIMDINGKEIIPPKYTQQIPLTIATPEGVIFEYDDLKDDTYESIQTNGKGLSLVRDARSEFFGCIDNEGKEIIPTVFEHLMFSDDNILFFGHGGYEDDSSCNFFSGDINSAVWGCLDINGKVLIEANYDCFKLQGKYILGGRYGSMLGEGQHGYTYYESEYSGVYDLYDSDGNLLIGGFREFQHDTFHNLFMFKFGGKWRQDCEDYDEWGNSIFYYSYHFEKGNSRWLIVDHDFKSIMLQKNGEKKSFLHHLGTITKKKEKDSTVNYWNMPLELFSVNKPRFDMGFMICGDDSEQFIVRISDGVKSLKYRRIEMISQELYFYTSSEDNNLVGIAALSENSSSDDKLIIDALDENTFILTKPINGYVFGMSNTDENLCQVVLYNILSTNKFPQMAISEIDNWDLIEMVRKGYFLLHIEQDESVLGVSVIRKEIFDEGFQQAVSEVKKTSTATLDVPVYWYSEDNRLQESDCNNNHNDDPNGDNEDYMRDTWDAMTDGMYGDMPDGFDGDFSFMGR